jgi:hypothetical protein
MEAQAPEGAVQEHSASNAPHMSRNSQELTFALPSDKPFAGVLSVIACLRQQSG